MPTRRLYEIDAVNGDIQDGYLAFIPPKRINGFNGRWLAMAQDAMRILSESSLSGSDFRVFFRLLEHLDFENLIMINQAEIARNMNIKPPNIRRSIKRLIDLGALLEGQKIGINRTFRLNPKFGWKGSSKNHVMALDQTRKGPSDPTDLEEDYFG